MIFPFPSQKRMTRSKSPGHSTFPRATSWQKAIFTVWSFSAGWSTFLSFFLFYMLPCLVIYSLRIRLYGTKPLKFFLEGLLSGLTGIQDLAKISHMWPWGIPQAQKVRAWQDLRGHLVPFPMLETLIGSPGFWDKVQMAFRVFQYLAPFSFWDLILAALSFFIFFIIIIIFKCLLHQLVTAEGSSDLFRSVILPTLLPLPCPLLLPSFLMKCGLLHLWCSAQVPVPPVHPEWTRLGSAPTLGLSWKLVPFFIILLLM